MIAQKQKMIYTLWLVTFIVMAITGFLPLILGKTTLSGWWMILHASIAPIFSISLAIGALYWAKSMGIAFNQNIESTHIKCSKKVFWFFLLLFIPNALSILLSMNTWFASSTQHLFLKVHFYSAIGMLLLVILHLNFSRRNKG